MDNNMAQDRLIGVKDVMQIYGVGKDTAMLWLGMKSCPTMPRKKGAPYLVSETAFREWVMRGGKKA